MFKYSLDPFKIAEIPRGAHQHPYEELYRTGINRLPVRSIRLFRHRELPGGSASASDRAGVVGVKLAEVLRQGCKIGHQVLEVCLGSPVLAGDIEVSTFKLERLGKQADNDFAMDVATPMTTFDPAAGGLVQVLEVRIHYSNIGAFVSLADVLTAAKRATDENPHFSTLTTNCWKWATDLLLYLLEGRPAMNTMRHAVRMRHMQAVVEQQRAHNDMWAPIYEGLYSELRGQASSAVEKQAFESKAVLLRQAKNVGATAMKEADRLKRLAEISASQAQRVHSAALREVEQLPEHAANAGAAALKEAARLQKLAEIAASQAARAQFAALRQVEQLPDQALRLVNQMRHLSVSADDFLLLLVGSLGRCKNLLAILAYDAATVGHFAAHVVEGLAREVKDLVHLLPACASTITSLVLQLSLLDLLTLSGVLCQGVNPAFWALMLPYMGSLAAGPALAAIGTVMRVTVLPYILKFTRNYVVNTCAAYLWKWILGPVARGLGLDFEPAPYFKILYQFCSGELTAGGLVANAAGQSLILLTWPINPVPPHVAA